MLIVVEVAVGGEVNNSLRDSRKMESWVLLEGPPSYFSLQQNGQGKYGPCAIKKELLVPDRACDQKHWAVHSMALLHNQPHTKESSDLCKSIGNSDFMFSGHGNYIQHCLVFQRNGRQKPRINSATLRFEAFDCIAEQPTSRTKGDFCITSTCVRLKQFATGRAQVVPCSENALTFTFPLLTSPASRKRLLIF